MQKVVTNQGIVLKLDKPCKEINLIFAESKKKPKQDSLGRVYIWLKKENYVKIA